MKKLLAIALLATALASTTAQGFFGWFGRGNCCWPNYSYSSCCCDNSYGYSSYGYGYGTSYGYGYGSGGCC